MALAGGGTGGHLFPGLALARHAATEGMVSSVLFFGAERGIEATLVPEHGFEVFAQPLTPVRGRGPADALVALVRLAGAAWVVRGELKRRRIDVMVGLGGYASVAGSMGAVMASVPLVLLEQNRRPGMANRLLAMASAAVCTSFEETASHFPLGRCRLTGNPVREELEDLAEHELLVVADGGVRRHRAVGPADCGQRAHDLTIELSDAVRSTNRHVELNIGHAERDRPEPLVGRVAAEPVAPWASRIDVVIVHRKVELSAVERLAHAFKTQGEPVEVRCHQADAASEHLRLVGR